MSPARPRAVAVAFERVSALRLALQRHGLAAGIALVAGVIGAAASTSPLLGLAAAGAAALVALALAQPALGAVAVAFLLWANVPVVAVRSHGVPMPIAAAYILMLLLPAAWHVLVLRRGLALTAALPWSLAWLGVAVLSASFSRDPGRSFGTVTQLALEGVLVIFLTSQAIRDRKTLRWVTYGLLASGAFMGAIALVQQATGRFDLDFGGFGLTDSAFAIDPAELEAQPRLAGPIGEKNRFGQIMLVLVALGVPAARGAASAAARRALLVATALSAVGAALTFSRGNALAFALLVPCMLALGTVSRRQVATLAALGLAVLLALPQYRDRLATIPTALLLLEDDPSGARPDGAIMGRATQVIAAGLVFADHPVLGAGPGLFRTYAQEYGNPLGLRKLKEEREAHALLPHIAAEYGALGLIAFCALFVVTGRDLWRRARRATDVEDRELSNAYLLALIAYFLAGLFLHLSFLRYFAFLVGVASAASRLPLAPPSARPEEARA